MPGQIPQKKIIEAVLSGVDQAQSSYIKWSGGYWLDNAPEYLVTCTVADKISKINGAKYLYLEHNVFDAMHCANAISKGRYKKGTRPNGKTDILLQWGSNQPRTIIELKSPVYGYSQCKSDVCRITDILNQNTEYNSFQFGLFGFYLSNRDGDRKTAKDKLEYRLKNIVIKAKEAAEKHSCFVELHSSQIRSDNEYAWRSCCLAFRRNTV